MSPQPARPQVALNACGRDPVCEAVETVLNSLASETGHPLKIRKSAGMVKLQFDGLRVEALTYCPGAHWRLR